MTWTKFFSTMRGTILSKNIISFYLSPRVLSDLNFMVLKRLKHVGNSDDFVDSYSEYRKKPKYGSRYLRNIDDVFEYNAWDHVEWGSEQEEEAKRKVDENSGLRVDQEQLNKFEDDASKYWDDFYEIHQNRFFKDRRWIFTEFPEIAPDVNIGTHEKDEPSVDISHAVSLPDSGQCKAEVKSEDSKDISCAKEAGHFHGGNVPSTSESKALEGSEGIDTCSRVNILEVGCGVGNTVFPILQTSADPNLFVYCCDFSSTAIKLVKDNPEYDLKRCHGFVCDVTSDEWNPPFPPNSLDFVILIFVLSAIHPDKMDHVAEKLFYYLKPGGMVMFRDYGRYDMAQLRFKKGRCLSDNFYARGDGTRVFFFTQDDLRKIFEGAGFQEKENVIDRRLQVNRGKLLKMYRVWVQAKYQKPIL